MTRFFLCSRKKQKIQRLYSGTRRYELLLKVSSELREVVEIQHVVVVQLVE